MSEFKQTWWDTEILHRYDDFCKWVGDENKFSKVFARKHVISKGYKSLVDVGCGNASEYFGYKKDYPELNYLGVDSSKFLNQKNTERGVPMLESPIEKVDLPDNSYEVAFSRHVLEHQPKYQPGLSELIRIASKEVINIFFIPPIEGQEEIIYTHSDNLYHNKYNKKDIEDFIKSNSKVKSFEWVYCGEFHYLPEEALIIQVA